MLFSGVGGFFMAPTVTNLQEGVTEVLEVFFGPLAQAQRVLHVALGALDGFYGAETVRPAAFGGAQQAPNLAFHHGRAMAVYRETVLAAGQDLSNFLEAFESLKAAIEDDDDNTTAHFAKLESALVAINNAVPVDTQGVRSGGAV